MKQEEADLNVENALYKELQQYLPFTVLKLTHQSSQQMTRVATVLTVHGIETQVVLSVRRETTVATVLTVHGIETQQLFLLLYLLA